MLLFSQCVRWRVCARGVISMAAVRPLFCKYWSWKNSRCLRYEASTGLHAIEFLIEKSRNLGRAYIVVTVEYWRLFDTNSTSVCLALSLKEKKRKNGRENESNHWLKSSRRSFNIWSLRTENCISLLGWSNEPRSGRLTHSPLVPGDNQKSRTFTLLVKIDGTIVTIRADTEKFYVRLNRLRASFNSVVRES